MCTTVWGYGQPPVMEQSGRDAQAGVLETAKQECRIWEQWARRMGNERESIMGKKEMWEEVHQDSHPHAPSTVCGVQHTLEEHVEWIAGVTWPHSQGRCWHGPQDCSTWSLQCRRHCDGQVATSEGSG